MHRIKMLKIIFFQKEKKKRKGNIPTIFPPPQNAENVYMCFVLTLRDCKLCWCVLQEKPVRPPCGITTPGCISMTTPQRGSLPSLSRTLSTPCSPMPASLSCSGTQWKGRSSLVYVHICTKMVATTQIQF